MKWQDSDEVLYRQRVTAKAKKFLTTRKLFAIDIFDTIIPLLPSLSDANPTIVRHGFVAFLRHYSRARRVVITDALTRHQATSLIRDLGLQADIDQVYGQETAIPTRVRARHCKDFDRIATDHSLTLNDIVVIGDGLSESDICTWYHIDFLRIPSMSPDQDDPLEFSFEQLIF